MTAHKDEAKLTFRPADPATAQAADPLGEFAVPWLGIREPEAASYLVELESATDEKPLQKYLANNPIMLAKQLDGGHGRWVIPLPRLGNRFIPDFIIGHRWSGPTWEWILVELQSPRLVSKRNRPGRLFTQNGRVGEQLDEGLKQINEWRRWIAQNIDTSQRPRSQMGLGLTGIESSPKGLLLIGRSDDLTEEHAAMRRQLEVQMDIKIHSYDWLARRFA